jgi:hypothetical protein
VSEQVIIVSGAQRFVIDVQTQLKPEKYEAALKRRAALYV